MKKLTYLVILIPLATMAEENAFTGGFLGGEINFNKQSITIPYSELGYSHDGNLTANSSNTVGVALLGGYGIDFGNNFIGTIEGKLSFTNTKSENEYFGKISKEYVNISMGYLQGYNIANKVMPYVKVSLNTAVLDVSDLPYNSSSVNKESDITNTIGFGYGFGTKIALTSNLELGAEWLKIGMKGSNSLKVKNKTIATNLVYKF